ncbi:prepilin-type N-terminal cleavage/methylation domain-containing protein [Tissierella sp. MSJ-40]|uniref:Prepilin-type N-terminal cleavage/methylation domain-containing protein n=1 Tax=Tissierella simiarum TaxID=2841534 RepID=A0ABS6E3Z9_9FIRM|nr:prepilin-type N-terminal cleavage/methylation domain-containing protein [Tissierella simiarum]MBU5437509.1 prepilin-type N-terminal cleavage/methylation domain-containing protein [Tissierella simiarum]
MKNREGLTLVELIITIAIVGIIAALVFMVFDTALRNIKNSRERIEAVFRVQGEINEIIQNNNTGEDIIEVTIPIVDINKKVKGRKVDIEEGKIKISTFIPNN